MAEERPVAVDEIVSLSIVGAGYELSAEHGAQHGVWVLGERGLGGGVELPAHVQGDHFIRHGTRESCNAPTTISHQTLPEKTEIVQCQEG